MSQTRIEWKVGLFALVSLVLAAALIVKFSKGTSFLAQTFEITMNTRSVGGLIEGAVVRMAGVKIGHVATIRLDADGKAVSVRLQILNDHILYRDADFSIKQAGFLGDSYVSIVPKENRGPELKQGDTVQCEEPFDLQEVARSAAGFVQRIDQAAKKVNDIVARIDQTLFTEKTLTNFTATVANLRQITEGGLATLNRIDQFVSTNTHPLSTSVSNLVFFSAEMSQTGKEIREAVASSRSEITNIVKNIETASLHVDQLITALQAGEGLIGKMLKNEAVEKDFQDTLHNLSLMSSNLNKFGLFYKPPPPLSPGKSTSPIYPGRDPHR